MSRESACLYRCSGILPRRLTPQKVPTKDVRVIKAESGRSGSERDAAHPVRWNEGRSHLRSTVHITRYHLFMPMQLFWRVCVVVNSNRDLSAFFEPEQRSGKLSVIGRDGHNAIRRDLYWRYLRCARCNPQARCSAVQSGTTDSMRYGSSQLEEETLHLQP
jgi:hypothetical protein